MDWDALLRRALPPPFIPKLVRFLLLLYSGRHSTVMRRLLTAPAWCCFVLLRGSIPLSPLSNVVIQQSAKDVSNFDREFTSAAPTLSPPSATSTCTAFLTLSLLYSPTRFLPPSSALPAILPQSVSSCPSSPTLSPRVYGSNCAAALSREDQALFRDFSFVAQWHAHAPTAV